MKSLWRRIVKAGKSILCVLLTAALITSTVVADSIVIRARGAERTFDIGVDPGSVTAVVDGSGLLTISGSGAIRDFTPDTAPFISCGVTGVKIGADITVIGDYTFYNCSMLRGAITLPDGIIRIGAGAFSGMKEEWAPRPDLVENLFTKSLVTRRRETAAPVTEQPESSEGAASGAGTGPSEGGEEETDPTPAPEEEPDAQPDPPAAENSSGGEGESKYIIEEVTQQEIGAEVFYPAAAAGAFTCSEQNESFRSAMLELGYQEAEAVLSAAFDCGEGVSSTGEVVVRNVAVVGGGVTLPGVPQEFSPPAGSELCTYSFRGWTEYRDDADVVRPAGSRFPVTYQTDLYFIADWTREVLVKLEMQPLNGLTVFSVQPVEGYTLTSYRWQYCEPEEGQELPQDQELLPWIDIPGEEGRVYEREAEPGDGMRLFRCVVTAQKQQKKSLFSMFAADVDEEELALAAMFGVEARSASGKLIYGPGTYNGAAVSGSQRELVPAADGYVTVPSNPYTAPTVSGKTIVFNGWVGSDGNIYDPGMIIQVPDDGLTLTAQWGEATVLYVEQSTWSTSGGNGTKNSPYRSMGTALNAFTGGTFYTNIVVLRSSFADGALVDRVPDTYSPKGGVTVTSYEPGTASGTRYTLSTDKNGGLKLGANVRFENITLNRGTNLFGTSGDDVYAEGYKLMIGDNVTTDGKLSLFGGNKTDDLSTGSPVLIVQSGTFASIFGGNYQANCRVDSKIYISGGEIGGNVYGGSQQAGSTAAGAEVYISGGTMKEVYGGGQAGDAQEDCLVVLTGSASATAVYGSCMGGNNSSRQPVGNASKNTSVLIGGNASVTGNVFGGGKGDSDNGHVSGNTSVIVTGGAIGGSVYLGCQTGSVKGSQTDTLAVESGTITGSVYGGGQEGAVKGNVQLAVSGGSMANVYGGGERGDLNSDLVSVFVGGTAQVTGNVFGGGKGADNGTNGHVSGVTQVTVADECTITGSVYGGCQNGAVNGTGDNQLTVQGGAIGGSVFGGGLSGRVRGNTILTVSGGSVAQNIYGGGSMGDLEGSSSVSVSGGSAQALFGGGYSGAVLKSSSVEVSGEASLSGSVYGGGEKGGVGQGAAVQITGGVIARNVYGGSMGESSSSETGAVQGDTSVTVTGGAFGTYTGSSGGTFDQDTGNIFGGGEFAIVKKNGGTGGNTSVVIDMNGSSLPGSVYGGGSQAPVEAQSAVTLLSGEIGGQIYGGGYGLSSSSGSTAVTVSGGAVGRNVYGGGAQGTVGTDGEDAQQVLEGGTSVTIEGSASVNGSVFGAGEGNDSNLNAGRVIGTAQVQINGGTVTGNVYGGGDRGLVGTGSDVENPPAPLKGATSVTINGGTVGSVFGGGSGSGSDPRFGSIFGNTQVQITGGSVNNAFGGSNYAYVVGDTSVTARAGSSPVTVRGSLFGGGNLQQNPDEVVFDENSYLVYGNSSVALDGSAPGVTVGGSVLGSGNLTLVYGTETVQITNYRGTLMAIQRASSVSIRDSEVRLTGESDATIEGNKQFSITKVEQLNVKNSTICLLSSVRELENLTSEDAGAVSVLQVQPGMQIKIGPVTGYGRVTGVFLLEMARQARKGEGVHIDADTESDWGDGVTNTGAFLRRDSELNADPEDSSQLLEMTSGQISGKRSYWQLGGTTSTLPETLVAPRSEGGGLATATATVELPTSFENSVYVITSVRRTEGRFSLVLPTDTGAAAALPEFASGQTADNTFALRLDPTGSEGWKDLAANADNWGAHVLTALPEGQSAWPVGVEGLWKQNASWPAPSSTGENGEITFTLLYESGYGRFSGGKVEIVFKEYPAQGDWDESTVLHTAVVELTLEGEVSGASQTAAITRGRTFSPVTGDDPVTITPSGAVTVSFLTEYYPLEAGANNICLNLCAVRDETVSPVNFPAGTCVVLADLSDPSQYRYYYYRTEGEEKISLAGFTSLGGSGSSTYPGPTDTASRNSEDLLFAVDFSGVDSAAVLPQGDYFIALTHAAGELPENCTRAQFSTTSPQSSSLRLSRDETQTTDTVWALVVTSQVPPEDTRYTDGISVHLSMADAGGRMVSFPNVGEVHGSAENVLRDRDGAVSFTLPANEPGIVMLDLSAVPESMLTAGEYTLTATMGPRAGLQMGSDQGARITADGEVTFRLARAVRQERSLSAGVSKHSQRIIDVSQGAAELPISLHYGNLQSGDRLEAVLFRKTGTGPEDSAYTELTDPGWSFNPVPGEITGSGGSLTLLIPGTAAAGTYRVRFRILDAAGHEESEELFNFIVKKAE